MVLNIDDILALSKAQSICCEGRDSQITHSVLGQPAAFAGKHALDPLAQKGGNRDALVRALSDIEAHSDGKNCC